MRDESKVLGVHPEHPEGLNGHQAGRFDPKTLKNVGFPPIARPADNLRRVTAADLFRAAQGQVDTLALRNLTDGDLEEIRVYCEGANTRYCPICHVEPGWACRDAEGKRTTFHALRYDFGRDLAKARHGIVSPRERLRQIRESLSGSLAEALVGEPVQPEAAAEQPPTEETPAQVNYPVHGKRDWLDRVNEQHDLDRAHLETRANVVLFILCALLIFAALYAVTELAQ